MRLTEHIRCWLRIASMLTLPVFLSAVPIDAQQSYRTQQSLRPGSTNAAAAKTKGPSETKSVPPLRFLGWKQAARQGSATFEHFLDLDRRRTPLLRKQVTPARPLAQGPTAPPATLPGIEIRPSLPAGLIPSAVATGDFNGDGKLDWAVANGGDNSVYIYLGNGDGTSRLPVIIPLVGQSPTGIAVADLNGDGKLDLAVSESDTQTVGILFGNGDGTFQPEVELPALPVATLAIAIADFNRDGKPDLIVGIAGNSQTVANGRFAVLLNTGSGNFGAPIYGPGPSDPTVTFSFGGEFSVADVNGDGIPDVLVTGPGEDVQPSQIYLGNGDGTFTAGQVLGNSFGSDLGSRLLTNGMLVDVNGDGCPDAIIVDTFAEASVYYGDCKGDFNITSSAPVYGVGDVPYGLAVADINGDGYPDLIIGGDSPEYLVPVNLGYATGNTIGVRLNDGTGHFGALHVYRGDPGMVSIAVADLAGTGKPSIITANQEANTVNVFTNDGSGGFGEPSGGYDGEANGTSNSPFNAPTSRFLVTDVNGDGLPDLALIEYADSSTTLLQTTVMLNEGNGQFAAPVRSPTLNGSNDYLVGDFIFGNFRNPTLQDFVGVSYDDSGFCGPLDLVYASNLGNGQFGPPQQIPLSVINACYAFPVLAVGDFNKDGKLDFAVASYTGPASAIFQLTIYLGNGDGTFRQASQMNFGPPQQIPALAYPQAIFVEDVNGDGKPDLLIWDNFSTFGTGTTGKDLLEFIGNGDGTFQPPKDVLQNLDYMTMADLNHDGLLDVVQIETTGLWGVTPATVTSYLGQPGGGFSAPVYSATPFADWFNIDFGNNVTLNVQGPYTGDFNGDGNLDVALFQEIGTQPATVQFLAGNGDGTFTPAYNTYDLGIQHILDVVMPNAFGDGRTAWVQSPNYPASFHLMPGIVAPAFQLSMFETPAIAGADELEISLNVPSTSATTVTLSASDPGVQLPPSATIPAGSLTVQVPFTLSNSTLGNHWFSITAAGNGTTASAYNYAVATGETDPFSLMVSGGLVNGSSVAPGQAAPWNAYVTANGEASSTFQVSCSNLPPGLSCGDFSPASFTVLTDGVASTAFSESTATSVAPGIYPFTITATDGFITLNAPATLEVGDFSLALSPPLVVSSTGTATFSLSVGQLYGYYANISLSCSNLPAGASCQPQTQAFAGGFSVPLVVNLSNTVAPGTYTFTLTGTSNSIVHTTTAQFQVLQAPAVSFSPAQVTFLPLLVGATAQQSITLTNSGSAPLSISNVGAITSGAAGNFSASSNCGTAVAVQASCTITVTLNATAVGPATGSLQVTDSASGSPQTVTLSASAVDFSISTGNGGSTSATISAGQSTAFSLEVVPNQIQGAIGLSCTGQPAQMTCFLAPSDVSVLSSFPVPFQVTVSTTAASAALPNRRNFRGPSNPGLLGLIAAAFFLGFGWLLAFAPERERRRLAGQAMLLAALCLSVAAVVSCGGGGSGASSPGPTNPGALSGTYILTVSGSDDGGSRSIQLTVIVQ